jgi:hypothetical protein
MFYADTEKLKRTVAIVTITGENSDIAGVLGVIEKGKSV